MNIYHNINFYLQICIDRFHYKNQIGTVSFFWTTLFIVKDYYILKIGIARIVGNVLQFGHEHHVDVLSATFPKCTTNSSVLFGHERWLFRALLVQSSHFMQRKVSLLKISLPYFHNY